MKPQSFRWRLAALGLAAFTIGCSRLDAPEQSGELVVAMLNDPVFYQPVSNSGEPGGFEYELVAAFAEANHLKLRIVSAATPARLKRLVKNGKVHFAASMAVQPTSELRFTEPLREAKLLLVQHTDAIPLAKDAPLEGQTVEVMAGSPAIPTLSQLGLTAPYGIAELRKGNDVDLLARVEDRRAALAATDSAHYDVAANFYPDLVVSRELPGSVAYAWAFAGEDHGLQAKAEAFLKEYKDDGRLARLYDRYFGHIKRIRPIDAALLLEDMRTLLPDFRSYFLQAQTLTGIDWRLLAALAYQESRWDPLATSPTGVRGMMMLTEDTADRLRVKNRLDPKESIIAGARYLADLMDRLPANVPFPDRQWLALAAYNLGMGHLNGARQFAVGMKRDPTSWYEMKSVLPLLARPEYYSRLKAGRARGGEAVILVENVRTFFDIIARHEPPHLEPLRTDLAMQ